jgi:hypothetical protein
MKYRPSTSFIVCLVPLLVVGGAAGWAWSKANSVPPHLRGNLSFLETLTYRDMASLGHEEPTPAQVAASRGEVLALKGKMLAEFPSLALHERPVPNDQNGFRLMYELADESDGKKITVTSELLDLLGSTAPWDPVAMRAALAGNSDLVSRIERIAALPQRSSANMPEGFNGFIHARGGKMCADIMIARSRLAAEAKDETEALRLVNATLNLASHYDQIETPTLLCATVAILVDLQVREAVIGQLLPALGRDADLPRWRAALTSRADYTADGFAHLMRGEWNISIEHLILPIILAMPDRDRPEDYEELIRAFSVQYDFLCRTLVGQKLRTLISLPPLPSPKTRLSAKSREILDDITIGTEAWCKGYARAAVIRARTLAALDLLILEKSGTALTAESISKMNSEPLSGEAFLYDPATRTISPPPTTAEKMDAKPLALPW